jgi:hypothetical protein
MDSDASDDWDLFIATRPFYQDWNKTEWNDVMWGRELTDCM